MIYKMLLKDLRVLDTHLESMCGVPLLFNKNKIKLNGHLAAENRVCFLPLV